MDRWKLASGIAIVVLLVIQAAIGLSALNDRLYLRPDSAEFLIGARSMVLGHGYRDLSSPDLVPLTRPIGTSLLLAPVTAIRGMDIPASRFVILLCSLVVSAASFQLSRRVTSTGWSVIIVALIVFNPVTLMYSFELISEVPFAAYTLCLLLLLAGAPEPIGWGRLVGIVALSLIAEKTRSQGLSLWPALFVWGACRVDRKRILPFIVAGFFTSVLFEQLAATGSASSSRYLPYLKSFWDAYGVTGVFISLFAGLKFYLSSLAAAVFPPAWPELKFEPLEPLHFRGLEWVMLAVGATLFIFTGITAYVRERKVVAANPFGMFVTVYLLASLALLALWPHRMGRLIYPLLPMVMVFAWGQVFQRLPSKIACIVATAALLINGACSVHWLSQDPMVEDLETSEWKKTAQWLQTNTPPHTRVATTAKRCYVFSHRQMWYAETQVLTIGELNQALAHYGIRYARFTDWQDEPIQHRNPVYLFKQLPVDLGYFPLWEVLPNRSGTVLSKPSDMRKQLERLDHDLSIKRITREYYDLSRARLLAEAGELDQAEQILQSFIQQHPEPSQNLSTAYMQLGDVLLKKGEPNRAIEAYRQVLTGYNADFFQNSVTGSIQVAQAYARAFDDKVPSQERSLLLSQLALGHLNLGRWEQAMDAAKKAATLDPQNTAAMGLVVYILRRFGQFDEATQQAETTLEILRNRLPDRQLRRQDPDYVDIYGQLLLIHLQRVLENTDRKEIVIDGDPISIDPAEPGVYVAAAEQMQQDDLAGVALHLLELGAKRHPNDVQIQTTLAQAYKSFGYFEEALKTYDRAIQLGTSDLVTQAKQELEQLIHQTPPY